MSILGRMLGIGRNQIYDRGIRFYDQGQYEQAIQEFAQIIDQETNVDVVTVKLSYFYTAESYAQLGQHGLKRGAWTDAVDAFQEALNLQPNYADLHHYRSIALRKLGRYDEAQMHLKRALEINHRFAKAIVHQGILFYEMNKREEGIARIEEALKLKPELKNGRFERAMEYHSKGEFNNALGAFETILASEAEDILFHAKIGDDLLRQRKYEEAVEEYRKALSINPRYADIRNHLGIALKEMGKFAEAIEEFKAAIGINGKYVEAYLNLAAALKQTGEDTQAREMYEAAQHIEPNNEIARAHLLAA